MKTYKNVLDLIGETPLIELSRLPRVAWLESSFALREVVNRAVPPSVFGKAARGAQRRRRAEA